MRIPRKKRINPLNPIALLVDLLKKNYYRLLKIRARDYVKRKNADKKKFEERIKE